MSLLAGQAGLNLGTGLLQGYQNKKAQERAFAYNTEMWNKYNQYNSPVEQMKRLREAGLNPNLVYGTGVQAATGQTKEFPKYQAESYQYEPVDVSDVALLSSQKEVMKQEVELKRVAALKVISEIPGIKTDNEIKMMMAKYQEQILQKGLDVQEQNIRESQQRMSESRERILNLAEQRTNMEVERVLKRSQVNLNRSQVNLNKAQINQIKNEIVGLWKRIALERGRLEQEKIRTKIQDFTAQLQANFPGVDKLTGAALMNLMFDIAKLFGAEEEELSIKRK